MFLKFRLFLARCDHRLIAYVHWKLFLKTFCLTIFNFFTEFTKNLSCCFCSTLCDDWNKPILPQYIEAILAHRFNITLTCLEVPSQFSLNFTVLSISAVNFSRRKHCFLLSFIHGFMGNMLLLLIESYIHLCFHLRFFSGVNDNIFARYFITLK